jgi:hypothetical protein
MSDDLSPVLSLPLIQPAQAQKHVTHNEALRLLDVLVQPAVASRSTATPPADPAPGTRYIVPAGALAAWAGQDGTIALAEGGGWAHLAPLPGWQAWVADEGAEARFDGTAWTTPAERPERVARLGVGTDADATNRLAVAAPASLFTHDGAGHQLKVNKAGAADTASLLFQTGWSGRAEIGTTGSDALAVKVSADGAAWATALTVADSGQVTAGHGLAVSGLVTGSAVAAPAEDAPGKLMQTGAGGLMRRGVMLADLNTAPANGARFDNWGSVAALNRPPHVLRGLVISGRSADTRWVQFAFGEGGAGLRRSDDSGGSWTVWERFFTSANLLGGVAQSGGVPTGAVIERGANANGEFLRLADGTQVCWRATLSAPNAATGLGALFRSGDVTWTYPATFAAAPALAVQVTGDPDAWAACGTVGPTQAVLRALSAVSKSGALTLCAIATGRWF